MAKIYNFPTKDQELDIADASYWVPDSVPEPLNNCLTVTKAYELLHINNDYYIIDDVGNYTAYYLGVCGRFI